MSYLVLSPYGADHVIENPRRAAALAERPGYLVTDLDAVDDVDIEQTPEPEAEPEPDPEPEPEPEKPTKKTRTKKADEATED